MSDELETVLTVDAETGEQSERPMTDDELAERQLAKLEQEAREAERIAKEEAKANGMAKLIALGLTEEEAGALING
jgi:L-fucose isomerase-like protein